MIQRIQTVYIFISAALIGLMLGVDFAELLVDGKWYVYNSGGISDSENIIYNGIPILMFIVLITLLHILAIFLYKKRILQIRILVFTIILLIGLLGVILYFMHASFTNIEVEYKIPLAFPLIAVILDYLAIRAIGKDEALVRSLDRIR